MTYLYRAGGATAPSASPWIHYWGGTCPIACWDSPLSPDQRQAPPGPGTPPEQTTPPASVGDTGNKRAVRILLEYYLVVGIYTKKSNVLKRNVLNPRA